MSNIFISFRTSHNELSIFIFLLYLCTSRNKRYICQSLVSIKPKTEVNDLALLTTTCARVSHQQ